MGGRGGADDGRAGPGSQPEWPPGKNSPRVQKSLHPRPRATQPTLDASIERSFPDGPDASSRAPRTRRNARILPPAPPPPRRSRHAAPRRPAACLRVRPPRAQLTGCQCGQFGDHLRRICPPRRHPTRANHACQTHRVKQLELKTQNSPARPSDGRPMVPGSSEAGRGRRARRAGHRISSQPSAESAAAQRARAPDVLDVMEGLQKHTNERVRRTTAPERLRDGGGERVGRR